ncbi:CobQ/CobB/MinD/ParA nucleotide binding domain-containing protein [Gammaproteobacteria bacterium]
MSHTVWVANGKGGVGKSVLMMVLAWQYDAMGRRLRLIDVDEKSKLSEFMGSEHVMSLKIGADAEALRANPALAYSYWDQMAGEIIDQDTGIDLGANMDKHVLDWARKSDLGAAFLEAGVTMDCYVPVTADPLAVSGGIVVLETVEQVFPASRRILVLNENAGSFDAYADTPEFSRIAAMRDRGLYVVAMDRCLSEAWTDFERLKLPPWRVLSMDFRTVAQKTGLGTLAARRAVGDYASWLKKLQQALEPLVKTSDTIHSNNSNNAD